MFSEPVYVVTNSAWRKKARNEPSHYFLSFIPKVLAFGLQLLFLLDMNLAPSLFGAQNLH